MNLPPNWYICEDPMARWAELCAEDEQRRAAEAEARRPKTRRNPLPPHNRQRLDIFGEWVDVKPRPSVLSERDSATLTVAMWICEPAPCDLEAARIDQWLAENRRRRT